MCSPTLLYSYVYNEGALGLILPSWYDYRIDKQQKPTRILVVDDEDIIHVSLDMMFEDWPGDVELVHLSDARKVLELAGDGIDLVLTDLTMPKLSGIEIVSLLKKAYPKLPVLIMTGYGSLDERDRLMEAGAMGLLSKPFTDLESFFCHIESALKSATVG